MYTFFPNVASSTITYEVYKLGAFPVAYFGRHKACNNYYLRIQTAWMFVLIGRSISCCKCWQAIPKKRKKKRIQPKNPNQNRKKHPYTSQKTLTKPTKHHRSAPFPWKNNPKMSWTNQTIFEPKEVLGAYTHVLKSNEAFITVLTGANNFEIVVWLKVKLDLLWKELSF